jgi:hypothetical protein
MQIGMNLERELLSRLEKIAGRRKMSALAVKAGLDQSILSRAKDGKNLYLENVSKILDAMGARVVFPDQDIYEITEEMRKKNLSLLPVRAAAGAGNASEDEEMEPKFHIAVPQQYVRPQIDTLLIEGRSMEPTILDKAVVGVNRESCEVVQCEIYAVRLPYEGVVVKRLFLDHANRAFVLRSDNKVGDFHDIKLSFDDGSAFICGKVVWVLQSYEKIMI